MPALGDRTVLLARIAAALAVAAVVAAGAVTLAALGSHSTRASAARVVALSAKAKPKPPRLLRGTGVMRLGKSYPTASGYGRYAYVLVGRADAAAAARLPGKSLVYMSGTSIQQSWSTGVSYAEALASDWLLKDAAGEYVMNVRFGAYVADIGNEAYQRRFVANVAAFLAKTRTDGVFLDDVIAYPEGLTGGVQPAKYPTSEAWEQAMVSFVSNVGRALARRGYYVLANASKFVPDDSRSDTAEHLASFWERISSGVSGLLDEYWLQNPVDVGQMRAAGSEWYENWGGWQHLVSVAQDAGKDFFGLMYGAADDKRAMRFGRASFMLDWNGSGGAFIYHTQDRGDPFDKAWVAQLGKPLGAKFERVVDVWVRRYERGLVAVNATNESVTVRLEGTVRTIGPTDGLFVRSGNRKP
jgi:Hypothetical glycosyl hydrolase family 15